MFPRLRNYVADLRVRYAQAPAPDKGMIAGGYMGAVYTSIRAIFTDSPLNVPLAGNIVFETSSQRFILGALVGGFVGSTIGHRFGQIADRVIPTPDQPPKETTNQDFLIATMPIVCAIAANVLMICTPVPGGNPIFGVVRLLSSTELHILTTLNGLFVGGTVGYRGGKFVDFFTGNKLIADLGLYSGYKYLRNKSAETSVPEIQQRLLTN